MASENNSQSIVCWVVKKTHFYILAQIIKTFRVNKYSFLFRYYILIKYNFKLIGVVLLLISGYI